MARLTVGRGEDVVRVDQPGRRLRSLEEEDVNVDEGRGLKRKREVEAQQDEYNDEEGEEEMEDDKEEEEPKKPKGPTKRGGDEANRRQAKRTGEYFNPPCERCERTGRGNTCERQQGSKACCHCHTLKQACSRASGSRKGKRKDEESSEDEESAPPRRMPAAKSPPPTRTQRERRAKAKSKHMQHCTISVH
jgi:hypothetical protein